MDELIAATDRPSRVQIAIIAAATRRGTGKPGVAEDYSLQVGGSLVS